MMTHAEVTGRMEVMEIRVRGQIDKNWSDWLGELTIAHDSAGDTILTGSVQDQAALLGLLNRLSCLGLQLVSLGPSGMHSGKRRAEDM